jgi:hypothetical protein
MTLIETLIEYKNIEITCHNPSLGLVTKVRASKGAGQEWSSQVTFHALRRLRVWESVRIEFPHFETDSWIFKEWLQGSKSIGLKSSLYHCKKILKHRCLKCACMTHLDIWNTSYGQKKGQKSNCQIWLLTIKSRQSPRFPCIHVACDILLKKFQWGLQLCLRPHLDRRFAQKNYGLTKSRGFQLLEFQDSHLGVSGENDIWVLAPWLSTKYIISGKVVVSPKFGLGWILWVCVYPWLVLTLKTFKLCINQLVIWFVQVRVSNWCLSFFLVPILELQHAPLPLKCCELGNVPRLLTFLQFSLHIHIWIYQGAWEHITWY